jgi:hypothetical protein
MNDWVPIKRNGKYYVMNRWTYETLWERPFHCREMCETACKGMATRGLDANGAVSTI